MKRKLIIVSVALALVCAFAVGMTIAYLKATTPTPVNNTFTVGNIQIDIWETSIDPEATAPVKDNEYHILPGMEYAKDPYVVVKADSEDCYVRMRVEIVADAAVIAALFPEDNSVLPQNYVDGWHNDVWVSTNVIDRSEAGKIKLEFRYANVVEMDDDDQELEPLFTSILVPGEIDPAIYEALEGLEINVYADAIQTASFADADAAWAAFNPEP